MRFRSSDLISVLGNPSYPFSSNMFEFDSEYKSKLDWAKLTHKKVADLMAMEVFLIDEFSMLDMVAFNSICECMSTVDHSRRPREAGADEFGSVHLLMFGDTPPPPLNVLTRSFP